MTGQNEAQDVLVMNMDCNTRNEEDNTSKNELQDNKELDTILDNENELLRRVPGGT